MYPDAPALSRFAPPIQRLFPAFLRSSRYLSRLSSINVPSELVKYLAPEFQVFHTLLSSSLKPLRMPPVPRMIAEPMLVRVA